MQNKANFRKAKMNVNLYNTTDYENKWQRRVRKNKANTNPIKANTKPIKANIMPKQTQYKPNQTQFQTQCLSELPYEEFLTLSLTLPGFDAILSPT